MTRLVALCFLLLSDFAFSQYNYSEVLDLAFVFYKAQRSGQLPYVDPLVPYRFDSALEDQGIDGEDLTGGYYDAGDHVKFGFPMAGTITMISWSVVEWHDTYEREGILEDALEMIKWATDFFIKAHVAPFEFYGQVAGGQIDHEFWGRPEEMTYPRESWKVTADAPGTDLVGETSAAMSAASLAFRDTDPEYAEILLKEARELYEFAFRYRGLYHESITDAGNFYRSSAWEDELVWAAAWLGYADNDGEKIAEAIKLHEEFDLGTGGAQSWNEKIPGANILIAMLTNDEKFKSLAEEHLANWMPGGDVPYTPLGLAWWTEWGSLRHVSNTAFMSLLYGGYLRKTSNDPADIQRAEEYFRWAQGQIGYALGDTGRSYVCGYGVNPPVRPHHRSSSCPPLPLPCGEEQLTAPGPNPFILYGALVGGPGLDDSYIDDREDYQKNEVANDYNAGFIGALAGLIV